MKAALTALFGCCLGMGVAAQDLPAFDDTAGFDIISVQNDIAVVVNAARYFECDLDRLSSDDFVELRECRPILSTATASQMAATLREIEDRRDMFLDTVSSLPDMMFIGSITRGLEAVGCEVTMDDTDPLMRAIAENVAQDFGYDGPIDQLFIDEIEDITDDAAELMMDRGLLFVNEATRTAGLTTCQGG